MVKPVILSDDLTGSMDAGMQLIKKGYSINVAIDRYDLNETSKDCDALILDTESRNVPIKAAYEAVRDSMEIIYAAGLSLVYKKVDSTLRGNVGMELQSILDTRRYDMIVFVPALPFNSRTTVDGYHYIKGRLLTSSDLAMDPFSPVKTSYIPDIINKQIPAKTGLIKLSEVRQGPGYIGARLCELHSDRFEIAVIDSETESDLEMVSQCLERCGLRILPCGSAGLFSRMFTQSESRSKSARTAANAPIRPVLIVSGSPAEASKLQIAAAKGHGIKTIDFESLKNLPAGKAWEREIHLLKVRALEILSLGETVILDGAGEGKGELYDRYKDEPQTLLNQSKAIQEALSGIVEDIIGSVQLSGLMMIGGDTAFNICRKLGAKGLKITGEVEPYVPAGCTIGGRFGSFPVVTKAGGFGTGNIIIKSMDYLRGEI